MNELFPAKIEVGYTSPQIIFYSYEDLLMQAKCFLDQVETLEVTPEALQNAKKAAASIRKVFNAMDGERKRIKADILEPYKLFEEQVKEILYYIDLADNHVRQQISVLEDIEKERKYSLIVELWEHRMNMYHFTFFTFNDFIKPHHLNKSMSLAKIEVEMAAWFEKISHEILAIQYMEHAEEILLEYKKSQDLASAINIVKARQKQIEDIQKVQSNQTKDKGSSKPTNLSLYHSTFIFHFDSENDKHYLIHFLKNNGIDFEEV